MSETVIDATGLRIWYGTPRGPVRAVDGVSFSVGRGEILGIVGESGCGKSTLGRGLLGLLPEGARMDGRLDFQGEDLLAMSAKERFTRRGRDLAMIFQEPLTRLNPLMRISEHFTETLRTHHPKMSPAEIETRSLDVLRLIGMTIRTARKAGTPVAVCGEMAGDWAATRLLLGMGLTEFSMHPASLLRVKQEILRADASKLAPRVSRLLASDDPLRVRALLARLVEDA